MTPLDIDIFKPVYMYSVVKNGRRGYIVIGSCDIDIYSILVGNFNAIYSVHADCYEYFGVCNEKIPNVAEIPYECIAKSKLRCRTLHTWDSFYSKIRLIFLNYNMKGIELADGIKYIEPAFVTKNNTVVCMFKSYLKKELDISDFKLSDGCILYEYKKSVLVLFKNELNKHTRVDFSERLVINMNNGRVTCDYKNIVGSCYFVGHYIYSGGWRCVSQKKYKIYGCKVGV